MWFLNFLCVSFVIYSSRVLRITDDEHELEEQQTLKLKPAIDDSLYDEMMDLLETYVKMSHQYSYRTKKYMTC